MDAETIRLTARTNAIVGDLRIVGSDRHFEVQYDAVGDDGKVRTTTITFLEVLQFDFRNNAVLEPDDIIGSGEVRVAANSDRLMKTVGRWNDLVPDTEWERKQGGFGRFRHFKLYFDDVGCFDVVASGCEISEAPNR